MAGRAPLAIKHRSRMARCTQNMPTCAQTKKHLERSYKYVPFWGLCMRWNWICRTICWTETSHTQKLCYTHTYGIRYTRMKILIGHSAHFAPPCPIAHRPLRIQSIGYVLLYTNPMQPWQATSRASAKRFVYTEKAGKPSIFVHLPHQIWKILKQKIWNVMKVCSCIFVTSSSLILPAFARTMKISSASWPLTWMRNDTEWYW